MSVLVWGHYGEHMSYVLAAVQCSFPPPPCLYCHFPAKKGSSCSERGKKNASGSTVNYNAVYRCCKTFYTPALHALHRLSRCVDYTDLLLQLSDSQLLVKPMVAGQTIFKWSCLVNNFQFTHHLFIHQTTLRCSTVHRS